MSYHDYNSDRLVQYTITIKPGAFDKATNGTSVVAMWVDFSHKLDSSFDLPDQDAYCRAAAEEVSRHINSWMRSSCIIQPTLLHGHSVMDMVDGYRAGELDKASQEEFEDFISEHFFRDLPYRNGEIISIPDQTTRCFVQTRVEVQDQTDVANALVGAFMRRQQDGHRSQSRKTGYNSNRYQAPPDERDFEARDTGRFTRQPNADSPAFAPPFASSVPSEYSDDTYPGTSSDLGDEDNWSRGTYSPDLQSFSEQGSETETSASVAGNSPRKNRSSRSKNTRNTKDNRGRSESASTSSTFQNVPKPRIIRPKAKSTQKQQSKKQAQRDEEAPPTVSPSPPQMDGDTETEFASQSTFNWWETGTQGLDVSYVDGYGATLGSVTENFAAFNLSASDPLPNDSQAQETVTSVLVGDKIFTTYRNPNSRSYHRRIDPVSPQEDPEQQESSSRSGNRRGKSTKNENKRTNDKHRKKK